MNYKNHKLTNKDMRVVGDELIFGRLFKDLGRENIIGVVNCFCMRINVGMCINL